MDAKGISKLDLKRRNRRQILLAIRNAGMLARVDIAAQLSLTRAAVTIITNQMIAEGILEDMNTPVIPASDEPRKKGRRKTMIRINPNYKFVLGAVIDEDFISVGLSNLADDVLDKAIMPIHTDTQMNAIVSFIVKSCRNMLKKASLSADDLLGLGIGIARERWANIGAAAKDGSVSFDALRKAVEKELQMPVFCGNSVSLYALANIDYTDPQRSNQLLIYSGTSVQTAVISNGVLLGGLLADTSAIDRVIIRPGGAKIEGYPDGSVRAELTKDALLRKVQTETGKDLTVEDVRALYLENDATVLPIINEAFHILSYLIYDLAVLYSAPRVVLQSDHSTEPAINLLQKLVSDFHVAEPNVTLLQSKVSGDRSFLAGCKLVTEKLFYDLGGMSPAEEKE